MSRATANQVWTCCNVAISTRQCWIVLILACGLVRCQFTYAVLELRAVLQSTSSWWLHVPQDIRMYLVHILPFQHDNYHQLVHCSASLAAFCRAAVIHSRGGSGLMCLPWVDFCSGWYCLRHRLQIVVMSIVAWLLIPSPASGSQQSANSCTTTGLHKPGLYLTPRTAKLQECKSYRTANAPIPQIPSCEPFLRPDMCWNDESKKMLCCLYACSIQALLQLLQRSEPQQQERWVHLLLKGLEGRCMSNFS